MKNANLEAEILRSCSKIINLQTSVQNISTKLQKLEAELGKYQESLQKEKDKLSTFGEKTSRRDGKPETTEEISKKEKYNLELRAAKLEAIKRRFPDDYKFLESILPERLRDENLE